MDGGMLTMPPPGGMQFLPPHNTQAPNTIPLTSNFPNNAAHSQPQGQGKQHTQYVSQVRQQLIANQGMLFDGKRMRKSVHRKVVDYNSSVFNHIKNRIWQRDYRDFRAVQPDGLYQIKLVPPTSMLNNPMNCVTTKFVRQSTNKFRCPIFVLTWTPEGRRLVTGASSGEFTLWNGLSFNFETILQAHDVSVRAMQWSHNDQWMVTADHAGFIKYWQTNMNNVNMYQGHKEAVRGISFCPSDSKFATCSDDGTLRIWDFVRCHEERILRGHGSDVKCVHWHPQKTLIASGSKDNQQPLKLWDPRTGNSLATIHAHKNTVMSLQWNKNGNWLLSASRDHLLKIFDIRNMKEEMQIFKGHKKEATAVAWHPVHEGLFASGGSDGAIMFWMVGGDREVGSMEEAHEGMVWSLAWHPSGHILASGSNDHSTKFWTRNRPGDRMRDRYNLNNLPSGIEQELLDFDLEPQSFPSLPGMGLEHGLPDHLKPKSEIEEELPSIPGLDWGNDAEVFRQMEAANAPRKKIPYARPIPRSFEQAWAGKIPASVEERVPEDRGRPFDEGDNSSMLRKREREDGVRKEGKSHIPSLMDESNLVRRPETLSGQRGGGTSHRGGGNPRNTDKIGSSGAEGAVKPYSNSANSKDNSNGKLDPKENIDNPEGGNFQSFNQGHMKTDHRGQNWNPNNQGNWANANPGRPNMGKPYGNQSDRDYRKPNASDEDLRSERNSSRSADDRSHWNNQFSDNSGNFNVNEDQDFRHQKDNSVKRQQDGPTYNMRQNKQQDIDYRQSKGEWEYNEGQQNEGENVDNQWRNEDPNFSDSKQGGAKNVSQQYTEGPQRGSFSNQMGDRRGRNTAYDEGTPEGGFYRKRGFDNDSGNAFGDRDNRSGPPDSRFTKVSRNSGGWNNNNQDNSFRNVRNDFPSMRGMKGSPRGRGSDRGRGGRGMGGNRGFRGGNNR